MRRLEGLRIIVLKSYSPLLQHLLGLAIALDSRIELLSVFEVVRANPEPGNNSKKSIQDTPLLRLFSLVLACECHLTPVPLL